VLNRRQQVRVKRLLLLADIYSDSRRSVKDLDESLWGEWTLSLGPYVSVARQYAACRVSVNCEK
jgi:hypothetical protein